MRRLLIISISHQYSEMPATFFISAIVVSDVANRAIVEFLEEWQSGFLIIIGCFSGGMAGLFLFAELEWNTLVGFVLGVRFGVSHRFLRLLQIDELNRTVVLHRPSVFNTTNAKPSLNLVGYVWYTRATY